MNAFVLPTTKHSVEYCSIPTKAQLLHHLLERCDPSRHRYPIKHPDEPYENKGRWMPHQMDKTRFGEKRENMGGEEGDPTIRFVLSAPTFCLRHQLEPARSDRLHVSIKIFLSLTPSQH